MFHKYNLSSSLFCVLRCNAEESSQVLGYAWRGDVDVTIDKPVGIEGGLRVSQERCWGKEEPVAMHSLAGAARRGAGGEHKGLGKMAKTTAERCGRELPGIACLRKVTKAPGVSSAGALKAEPRALREWIPSKCGQTYAARQAEQPWEPGQLICSRAQLAFGK